MRKLRIFRKKHKGKGEEKETDANTLFSTYPDAKRDHRVYTEKELEQKRYKSAGKYR